MMIENDAPLLAVAAKASRGSVSLKPPTEWETYPV
jgi:hypothetical protein